MNELKTLLDTVTEMRAAQKLEWDALPGNYERWKRTRQQMRVAQLEENVDALLHELRRAHAWTGDDKG